MYKLDSSLSMELLGNCSSSDDGLHKLATSLRRSGLFDGDNEFLTATGALFHRRFVDQAK